ncbi:hypothetical protein H2200_013317 [Cladophialophora chaetospira]|uniref:Copper homeostasis protein cutC homolog n=1 Tax=Cladophialophora chaetospira TaxID=386627 RepID=A0AA39CBB4_9EURO|nr:hypothetical protein H2200_013317 [Cladophialophora chaetospira]
MPLIEIACFDVKSALIASEAGADRIELCDNADVGGTTPPLEWLYVTQGVVKCPVNVMIRPRGGNFVYTNSEFDAMKNAVQGLKSSRMVDGFVFGVLHDTQTIDIERTTELVNLADPLPCTFHRAFDEAKDLPQALEDVISCGIKTILTSGGASTASQGTVRLAQLAKNAGDRIVIMPGGGVRSSNIDSLEKETRAGIYHSSALLDTDTLANAQEIKNLRARLHQEP